MKKYILFSIIVFAVFISTFAAVPVQAENAPYVNAAVADNEFNHITAQCMDVIRSKKILLASRSWGFGMRSGLYTLPDSYGSMYNMVGLDYSADYDVRVGGLSAIPTNAFSLKNFVQFVWADSATGEMDQLIRNGPHNFKDVIDVAMLFGDSAYPNYFEIFDALRSDFPNIKFIYTTIGFESSDYPDRNSGYATYSAQIRATYQGIAPLYDEGLMCNDDGRCGDQYCPEYSTDPAGLHPNTIFINERLAKGFLVLLSKLYCDTQSTPYCGDSSCNNGETCSSCQVDCGICQYTLAVAKAGTGSGTVTGTGISCGSNCTETVNSGTSITLSASANSGSTFAGWSGGGCSGTGNCSVTVTSNVTVAASFNLTNDSQAPTVPTNLTATAVSSGQINLAWTASTDNVGVTGYRIYRCIGSGCTPSTQIATVAGTTYSDTGLTANTIYVYRVVAFDAIGNVSTQSSSASATTPPPVTTGPVAWWKFDETSGTTASDSSGNNYTGTLVNGPVWTTGKIGNALSFDGVNDYVSANIPSLSSITISAWVRTPIPGSTLRIIDANWTVPLLRFDNSSVQFIGNVFLTSNTTFLANQWYHLVAVGDANGHKLYVNGSLDNSNSTAYTASNGNPILIGGSLDLFNGLIDDVRVYNRALSQSEIQTLYNAGAADTAPPAAPTGVAVK